LRNQLTYFRRLGQQQQLMLNATNLLINSIQLNHLIGHSQAESELCTSADDAEVEEDDG
jgi:hypothetical protein